jgi:hypothetical protein
MIVWNSVNLQSKSGHEQEDGHERERSQQEIATSKFINCKDGGCSKLEESPSVYDDRDIRTSYSYQPVEGTKSERGSEGTDSAESRFLKDSSRVVCND